MAGSRYEYVKVFEEHDKLLPGCWAVIRLDGRAFTKFAKLHAFCKPNDARALRVANAAARHVMRVFDDHLALAFGQSDEFSFVLRRESTLFSRRRDKILSTVVSLFSSAYVRAWPRHMWRGCGGGAQAVGDGEGGGAGGEDEGEGEGGEGDIEELQDTPSFDGRIVLYPTTKHLRDYLSWRQADVHVNNLFNTTFWALAARGGRSQRAAELELKGTLAKDKHEILFSQFGINYNNEPPMFRKGTVMFRARGGGDDCARGEDVGEEGDADDGIEEMHVDIIGDSFWTERPHLLGASDLEPPRLRKR